MFCVWIKKYTAPTKPFKKWVSKTRDPYVTEKDYLDKILILLYTAASQNCALTVQLLRLLLNFMDHKARRNKASEQLYHYNSVKTRDIFHIL